MPTVPSCARVSCWLNAWVARRRSADDVISGLLDGQLSVEFVSPIDRQPLSPAMVLGALARLGVRRVSAALPTPGDLLGLGGPAGFNADALDAGEAVLWLGAAIGFIPTKVGRSTSWRGSPATAPTYLPDVASADRDLRRALTGTAQTLADLDVASWNPDVADALLNLRDPGTDDGALPFASPLAARTAMSGLRCEQIADLAMDSEGGALSSGQVEQRWRALVLLRRSARAAIVAACSSVDGR